MRYVLSSEEMKQIYESKIKKLAQTKWEEAGRPTGRDIEFWLVAEKEQYDKDVNFGRTLIESALPNYVESQKEFKTVCDDCKKELSVPIVEDCGMSFKIAPAKCQCGWVQSGKWLKAEFVADCPVGYFNLRNMK